MLGKVIKNWDAVDFHNLDHQKNVKGAIQYFFSVPDRDKEVRAALQAFTTKGEFPPETFRVLERLHDTPTWDEGYQEVFDIRDFTSTNESGFDLANVTSGIVFKQIQPGEKAKLHTMSGTSIRVLFEQYAAGLGWSRTLIDDKKWWDLEDNLVAFRAAYYKARSQSHYDLIDAVPAGQNVAWQNADPATLSTADARYTMARDAATIDYACLGIQSDLKDTAMVPNINTPFVLLAPVNLRRRILKALDYMPQAMAGGVREVQWNIRPVFTMQLAATDKYYVCLPKGKAKGGNRMDLTLMADFDMLAYADAMAGWGRWGAAIGEVKQFRRCAIA